MIALAAACALLQPPPEPANELRLIKRLYIDKFGGGEASSQVRDMVIAALSKTRLFIVTENPERADAILRGSAEDLVFTDVFQTSDGVTARTGIALGRGSGSSRNRESVGIQAGVGDQESTRIQERKHEASASVRIVNRDGDVIWSTTQESQGGKFRSASADVADKIARALLADWEKGKPATPGPGPGGGKPGSP
ncbi:MAG: hypothetical protein HXY18_11285 [Bryobacteraceae bacterium]|nr:hypothetical protein [Bryobacteraceae bacterium]